MTENITHEKVKKIPTFELLTDLVSFFILKATTLSWVFVEKKNTAQHFLFRHYWPMVNVHVAEHSGGKNENIENDASSWLLIISDIFLDEYSDLSMLN